MQIHQCRGHHSLGEQHEQRMEMAMSKCVQGVVITSVWLKQNIQKLRLAKIEWGHIKNNLEYQAKDFYFMWQKTEATGDL